MKRYTTFEEIDRDLKYLRLKSQIDLEEIKLSFNLTKNELKESLSPITFISNTIMSILKKAFILKMVDKIVGIKSVKKEEYNDD